MEIHSNQPIWASSGGVKQYRGQLISGTYENEVFIASTTTNYVGVKYKGCFKSTPLREDISESLSEALVAIQNTKKESLRNAVGISLMGLCGSIAAVLTILNL